MRVGLLVNIDNLAYWLKGDKLDYGRYKNKIESLYPGKSISINRLIAYGSFTNRKAFSFKAALRKHLGYELKATEFNYDWNVTLTIDAISMMNNIDSIVLGSNDPQLIPLINYLTGHGISVYIFAANIPSDVKRMCTYFLEIDSSILEVKK